MPTPALAQLPCLFCGTQTANSEQFCCSGCRFLFKGDWKKEQPQANAIYLAFDQPEVRQLYNLCESAGGNPSYRLAVKGLECSSCVHVLEDLPKFLEPIISARIHFAKSELYIETTPTHSLGNILKFLEDMGYPARPLRAAENRADNSKAEDRTLLMRIAVAGACAGNISLFSVAVYAGLAGPTAFIFNCISLALFLPVLLYSAYPIYRGAWTAARLGYLTVDVPLAIALWLSFFASLFNWWRGSGNIYFDSTAGFFFLILTSRWFLRVSQRHWGQNFFLLDDFTSSFFNIDRLGEIKKIPASQIATGDRLFLSEGQVVPIDGLLVSKSAAFDTSWITGESIPRTLVAQMPVPAGFKLMETSCEIIAKTSTSESELSQSLRRIESQSLAHSKRVGNFDKAAQFLLLGVFLSSIAIMISGPLLGLTMNDTFERALSLLIVACPCALAFGGPLAYGLGLKKASRKGILIKSVDVFDRIAECKTLVFDKTGTLTRGELELVEQHPQVLPEWIKSVILTLESQSHHPVAYAFRKLWPNTRLIDLRDINEIIGKRVFGVLDGRLFSIETVTNTTPGKFIVALFQDGQQMATFEFEDRLREDTVPVLKSLAKKYSLNILSGDQNARVENIVKEVGLRFDDVKGHCSPQEKAAWLKKAPPALMLGDGLNDAEALSVAHVGIAVQGPLLQGLGHGSVYFLKAGISPLLDLLLITQQTRALLKRNLYFALVYNVCAGVAALGGFVNPLVAALLMPVSTLLILLSTWEASR